MRIVFMGAAELSLPALKWLIQSEHQVVAVYTQPDKPAGRGRAPAPPAVKSVALEHGLTLLQPTSLKDAAAQETLAQFRPDVIVVAAYGRILPGQVLALPPFGCLNIHPSLLPRHRGPSPIQGAILAGDESTGVTIILLDEGLDTGPIIAQRRVAIEPGDTTQSLTERLAQIGARLLGEALPLWLSRSVTPQPQEDDGVTYTRLFSKQDGEVDWHLPAAEIGRRVRAFHPWPGCYTRWQGKMLKILEADSLSGERGGVGRVVALEEEGIGVQTGDGIIGLRQVQLEGKRAMSGKEFLRGQRQLIGALLPSPT